MTIKFVRAAGGNWSADATWSTTSGGAADTTAPTAADEAIANAASGNIAVDTSGCVCRSLDCNGYTGTLTINASSAVNIGDATAPTGGRALRLSSGMTWAGGGFGIGLVGTSAAGTMTIDMAGKTMTGTSVLKNNTGVYHLASAYTAGSPLTITAGTFVDNGFAVSISTFTTNGGTLTATGVWSLTATGAVNIWNVSGGTQNMTGSTIAVTAASASTRTFIGGGKTYDTLTYTVAGSTGQLTITGQNTFGTINFSDVTNARTLAMPTSSGTTVTGTFNVNGTSGKLMTVTGDLTKTAGTVSCNYLSISNSDAAGGAAFYAGANSTNGGSNTGWVFTAPPNAGSVGDSAGRSLNRLAGTTGLDAQGAANVWAGTVGKDLVGALNTKAGGTRLEYNGVCQLLASQLGGTTGLDAQGSLASIP
jgi:hypothetical protein